MVSLDSLRQLGQLLGLSAPQANKISPYTGTKDTLTPATPLPPQTTPAPTPPPAPTQTTAPSSQDSENQRGLSLNRISERT